MHFLLKKQAALPTRVLSDNRGVAAVEFAFIAPLLVTLVFGVIELSNMLLADTKLRSAVSSVSDLITQKADGTITSANLQMANYAALIIMAPVDVLDGTAPLLGLRVTNYDTNMYGAPPVLKTKVWWSVTLDSSPPNSPMTTATMGMTPTPRCTTAVIPTDLPAGLNTVRNQVVKVEGKYLWKPWFTVIFPATGITLSTVNYNLPRFSIGLDYPDISTPAVCP